MPTVSEGDRIELIEMTEDPCPIESGATGTVRSITHYQWPGRSWTQIGVTWDNGRMLHLVVPPDRFRVLSQDSEKGETP